MKCSNDADTAIVSTVLDYACENNKNSKTNATPEESVEHDKEYEEGNIFENILGMQ